MDNCLDGLIPEIMQNTSGIYRQIEGYRDP